jgi:hypothetical protein
MLFPPSHGLRTPNEAFFHKNPKLLGLGRQFGQQINSGAFWGIFGQTISTHFVFHYSTIISTKNQAFISKS